MIKEMNQRYDGNGTFSISLNPGSNSGATSLQHSASRQPIRRNSRNSAPASNVSFHNIFTPTPTGNNRKGREELGKYIC